MSRNEGASFSKSTAIILSVFGILPWYSFKKGALIYPKMFKVYSIVLFLGGVALSASILFLRSKKMFSQFPSTVVAPDIITEMAGLSLIAVVILGSALWNMQSWENLFRLLRLTEKSLGSTSADSKLVFLLGNISLITLSLIDMLDQSNSIAFLYITFFVYRHFYLLTAYTVLTVAISISRKYRAINRLFQLQFRATYSDGTVQRIRRVKKIYFEMSDITRCFNILFGWPVLLLLFYPTVNGLTFFSAKVNEHLTWTSTYTKGSMMMITFVNAGYLLLLMIWLTAVIICCDSVVRETDELLTNCYRLEYTLPMLSRELEELESLKRLIKNKRPKLTAAGFFEIRRSTLLSLLGVTTTYFIVALQFNSL